MNVNPVSDVGCPFCGLLCDDLIVSTNQNGELSQCDNACNHGRQQFELACRNDALCAPLVARQSHSQNSAIEQAAQQLATASSPMIAGLATDVAGVRAAIRLAEMTGAGLDHMNGRAIVRNQCVLQRTGWFTTTLTEIKNRADLVILIDDQILNDYPRLMPRVLRPQHALLQQRVDGRHIVALNENQNCSAADVDESINTPSLLDLLFELRQCLQGPQQITADSSARQLCQRIMESEYAVFIWSAGRLASAQADLIIDVIGDIIRTINIDSRAAGLPIAGSDGDVTANQVCTWQTGLPLRMQFINGQPQADLVQLDTADRVAAGDVDCLVWIDSLNSAPVPEGAATTIIIATPNQANEPSDVFIPVETPGVGAAGLMVRTDSVVTVPLKSIRAPRYPQAADVLNQLYDAVQAKRAAQVSAT